MSTLPYPMYGISKHVAPGGLYPAWLVQLKLESGRISKTFGFRRFGGEIEAFKKAQEYRDSLLSQLPGSLRTSRAAGLQRTHHTGELLNIHRNHPGSNRGPGWRVEVILRGAKEIGYFSDAQYGGYEESLKAAKEYRDYLRSLLPRNQPVKPTR